jgi:hypothetical protein
MKRINAVAIACVLVSSNVAAQKLAGTAVVAPEVQIVQRRSQFQLMEAVIENHVRQGAQEVATRAQGVMPVGVLFIGQPKARGFPLENYGVVFNVEIPDIRESAVLLNQMTRPSLGPPAQTGNRTVSASGVVADDPMVKSPLTNDPFLADPNEFYRDVIKQKLVDAMLDYSRPLDIAANETLSIVARGEPDPFRTSLLEDSKTMILRIKGSDLALLYSGKITRDEARKLVIESQF